MTDDAKPMEKRLSILSAVVAAAFLAVVVAGSRYGREGVVREMPIVVYLVTACLIAVLGWSDARRGHGAPGEGAVLIVAMPWALAIESIWLLPAVLVPSFIASYGPVWGTLGSAVAVVFVTGGLVALADAAKRRLAPQWTRPTRAEILREVETAIASWNLGPDDAISRDALLERVRSREGRSVTAEQRQEDRP